MSNPMKNVDLKFIITLLAIGATYGAQRADVEAIKADMRLVKSVLFGVTDYADTADDAPGSTQNRPPRKTTEGVGGLPAQSSGMFFRLDRPATDDYLDFHAGTGHDALSRMASDPTLFFRRADDAGGSGARVGRGAIDDPAHDGHRPGREAARDPPAR